MPGFLDRIPSRSWSCRRWSTALPAAVKQEVRQIAHWTLHTIPEFRDLAGRYQDLAEEMAQHRSDSQASHASDRDHALENLVDRMSPILL